MSTFRYVSGVITQVTLDLDYMVRFGCSIFGMYSSYREGYFLINFFYPFHGQVYLCVYNCNFLYFYVFF